MFRLHLGSRCFLITMLIASRGGNIGFDLVFRLSAVRGVEIARIPVGVPSDPPRRFGCILRSDPRRSGEPSRRLAGYLSDTYYRRPLTGGPGTSSMLSGTGPRNIKWREVSK